MNNYHIYEQEAKGKYSVIFKARRKKKLQFVAIKRMEKNRKAKINNQAKILANLHHPNIIKFYDYMETKNHMWAVTQFCPGGDLLKIVEIDKNLPQHTVRSFTLQIMAGLQHAHSKGVVICDLKLATILLNQYGNIKIGDFGSSQTLIDLMRNQFQKKKGTPSYMAPQLFQVGGVYSFQTDFWALGCMMYELSQGNPPFVSTTFHQISQLAKSAPCPKVDHFSSDFNHLLSKLLEKDPAIRINWKQIIRHPWIRNQLPQQDIPEQIHFLQYLKNRKSKGEKLRLSQTFQNYGIQTSISDRRQQFVFQNDQDNQQAYLCEQEKMQQQLNFQQGNFSKKNVVGQIKVIKKQNRGNIIEGTEFLQDSTNINMFMQAFSIKSAPPIQEVINHQSDTAVKPIIGNKDIQTIQSINFNKKSLGFQYIQPEILAEGILNGQMDTQLKKILEGMKGQQKTNVLGYFQSIIQNSQIANYLFKSSFISYYMSLVKGYKQSSLRAKICEIIGFLIRHATSIESDILKYGIISGFVESVTKDKSEKVRRKAMAALGQLLFYGATQVDQDAMQWDISLSLISTLLKILKNVNQDEIVRIYCCKSIQNITAQAQKVGLNFSQIDTILVMINCFNTTKNQGFRTSIMCCVHHMITLNSTLRQFFIQKMSLSSLIVALKSQQISSKSLQIILWILLQQFYKSFKSKISKQILQNNDLFKVILSLLDNSSSVVKGRVFLFINFSIRYSFKRLLEIADSKIFQIIERHGKDSPKYQSQCLQFILVILYQNFQKMIQNASQQVQQQILNKSEPKQRNNYLMIIGHMLSCPLFQDLFSTFQHVQALINFMNLLNVKTDKIYLQNFKNHYFMIMQKIFNNCVITEKLQQNYAQSILPFLIGKIIKSTQEDVRFSCIKYFISLVRFCMSQQFLYDSTILSTTSTKISSLVCDHLIPQLGVLFDQGEKIASMMFKLTSSLLQISHKFIQKFIRHCQLSKLLPYYNDQSTANALKTIQLMVSSNLIQSKDLQKLVSPTLSLLQLYVKSGQQLYIQFPISILTPIVTKKLLQMKNIDIVWDSVVQLQGHQDPVIRQKSQILIQSFLLNGQFSLKGKWQVKDRKGIQNYEKFIKLSGQKFDAKVIDGKNLKQGNNNRYQ